MALLCEKNNRKGIFPTTCLVVVLIIFMTNCAYAQFKCPEDMQGEWCEIAEMEQIKNESDKQLNQIYSNYIKKYSGKDREAWVKAERAWVVFFQAQCSAEAFNHWAGSNTTKQLGYLTCLNSEIKKRIEVLKSFCELPDCK